MYSLRLPRNIYSDLGALKKIRQETDGKYKNVAIIFDGGVKKAGIVDELLLNLNETALKYELFETLSKEPTCDEAQDLIDKMSNKEIDGIIALGGGSVIDLAKLASISIDSFNTVRGLIENPLKGKRSVGLIIIPTTAGTGAEATPNSIVLVPERELKVGIVNPQMIPDTVILDGELIKSLPKNIVASTGTDALCHAIECYTSKLANPISDLFAREALKLIINNLEKSYMSKENLKYMQDMLLGSFYAGVAIASSGTTAIHALSYPLGGKYHIPHGIANGMLLLAVMKFNKTECVDEFANIYDMIGLVGAKNKDEKADAFLDKLEMIINNIKIPRSLKDLGIVVKDIDGLVNSGMEVQRLLKNNKKTVEFQDAKSIYQQIM